MPKVELSKEECKILVLGMQAGLEQAEEEIKSFKADAKTEDVTASLIARSLMQMIKTKMEQALTSNEP